MQFIRTKSGRRARGLSLSWMAMDGDAHWSGAIQMDAAKEIKGIIKK